MSKTEVRFCTCHHPGQDSLHGVQRRVHNQGIKGWKCTVCTNVTAASSEASTVRKGKGK